MWNKNYRQVALVFVFGLLLRMVGIYSRPLNHDEICNVDVARTVLRVEQTYPLANEQETPIVTLSTPLMGYEHPLLSVYLTRLSAGVFGWNSFGERIPHVVLGAATTLMLYFLAQAAFGHATAILAMFLMSISRFHIGWCRTVQPQSALLFMVVLSLYVFWKTIESKDRRSMLLLGVATGFAYLAKEEAILLLPVFFLFLLCSGRNRFWFRRKELYLALGLTLLIGSVDLLRLFQEGPRADMSMEYYLEGLVSSHVSLCPVKFFLGELFPRDPLAVSEAYADLLVQGPYVDLIMHWITGAICLVAVGYSVKDWKNDMVKLLLITFFFVFGFFMFGFTLAEANNPYWHANLCLIPALILASRMLMKLNERWGRPGAAVVCTLMLYLTFKAAYFVTWPPVSV